MSTQRVADGEVVVVIGVVAVIGVVVEEEIAMNVGNQVTLPETVAVDVAVVVAVVAAEVTASNVGNLVI